MTRNNEPGTSNISSTASAKESYVGHSQLIVDSERRKAYEAHDPVLPEFLALAIQIFAEHELD